MIDPMLTHFEILDSITESMAIINASGQIIFTNKAWRLFSKENMGDDLCTGINSNYLSTCESVGADELQTAAEAKVGIQKVIDKKLEIFELEYPCHSHLESRWFILRASQVKAHPQLTLLAHINITNRKIAELEVEKNYNQSLIINERLNTTLHKIVHDIQNPLSGIIGLIDLSKLETDVKTLNEYLALIEESSSHLSTFVKDTLKHISSSGELQTINVHSLINQYLETVAQFMKSKAIDIRLDIKQEDEFLTNAIEFQSILSNLISNAIKYADDMKAEKFIAISFDSDSKRGILKIEDNGIGIKEHDIPKIMQFNFQVKKTSSSGVGLGLFMVKKSINNLGGSIKITSEFGIGSKFVVEIPNRI